MITGAVPVPVLTVSAGRAAVRAKLSLTQAEASALSFNITRCHAVGATVVCSFSMRMLGGVTCVGRVQVRASATGGAEGRYLGPKKHPQHVVCS